MEKFNRALRGYDVDEVNAFLDQVITQVEKMIGDIKEKNNLIFELENKIKETEVIREKLDTYEKMEDTLSKAIMMAQKTSDQMKVSAHEECERILIAARGNANRILNEALMKADKTESEALMLRRNINLFKRRLKDIVEAQIEVIDTIEKVDF